MSPRIAALAAAILWSHALAGEVTIGAHRFTIPDGFELEVAAGPDLVPRPIGAAFDEQGRLYVSDSSGSNDKTAQQLIDRPHRIVRLEDTDGDGRFDRRTVFADRLMFPEGVMWLDGSLFVGAPPSIWKLTDTDGDGVADKREEWYQGGTLTGCANDIHGPYPGPDGWIYWCKGAFAEQTHERPGRAPLKDRASHIFRCRPDGSGLESVMSGGMDNPVAVAFTREGEPIFTSTFLDLSGDGKRDGLAHAVYGGVFPKVNEVTDAVTRTGPLLPAMTHFGPGAPCGFARLKSNALGDDYRDSFLACLFNLHKVTRHVLEPVGATFHTRDSDLVVSDNVDFHPTDAIEDADGSVLIVDTGGWYKLCCPTSQLAKPDVLGAIYRLRRKDAPKVQDARGLQIEWSKLEASDVAGKLADFRPVVADKAAAELVSRGTIAVAALQTTIRSRSFTEAREKALWAVSKIPGDESRQAVREALEIENPPELQQTAAKIAGFLRDPLAREKLLGILSADGSRPSLRRVAAEALGRIGDARAVPALLAATTASADDRFLEHALIYALIEIGDAKAIREGLPAERASVTRRAALIALGELGGDALSPQEVIPLLNSPDALLKETALWVAGRHAEWGGALAESFRKRLENPAITDQERADLEALLASSCREPAVQQMAATVLRESPPAAQAAILRVMAHAELKTIPAEWIDALAQTLTHDNSPPRREAITTAALFAARKEAASLATPLLAFARDAAQPEDLRLNTLAALPAGTLVPEPPLFEFLRAHLDRAQPATARTAAATALTRAKLDDTQRTALADVLPQLGPLELTRLLPAFDRALSEPLARRLLDALGKAPALTAGQAPVLRAILQKLPASLGPEGNALLARLDLDTAQQRAKLETIAAELPPGDVRRGQLVFNSAKASCTICHSMGYLGGKLGPDLTSVGQVRSERDLLEAVVFPSASFVRSYEPMKVRMKGGVEFIGIVRSENGDAVTLAIGPGVEQRCSRADIEEMTPGTTSLMPQGFDQILSRQELADLVVFLKASVRLAH